ncbi:MAG: UDP-N-acetylmuramoyl-L-alanyl-D-glutamate--2,6-diaminopimelate ligase [Sphingobacteriales bacterium]|jgi:UDP-N-acetylmuramoyl-L-alanyl-D-glutamate--2,6-diaminopimelate ligase
MIHHLTDLLYKVPISETRGTAVMKIENIQFDSRAVKKNDVFVAIRGSQVDGHKYISKAIELGASVVVCEIFPLSFSDEVTYIKVDDSAAALSIMASNYFDNPSDYLKLVGVTGTNGKTTIVTLLHKLFTALGYPVGMISTVQNMVEQTIISSTHTTPDPIQLNSLLAEMVQNGCTHCFMEVSSHAIHQKRVAGLLFAGGIFSNITHDHLDYHKTFDEYITVKKKFFDDLPKNAFALTNSDDKRGMVMLQNTKAHKYSYSLQTPSDFKARILENNFQGMLLDIEGHETWFKLVGEFNAYNLMAVLSAAQLLDIERFEALVSLSELHSAEGRFEYFINKEGVIGIVDYAHTPDALKNVLQTIQKIRVAGEKIITVIGCGGDRDKTKRPLMAKVAVHYSDQIILTADNPRSEDPNIILDEMMGGVGAGDKRKVMVNSNRREAIKTAYNIASKGDIILIAGKGHEKYQEVNGVKTHFDDKEELLNLFES